MSDLRAPRLLILGGGAVVTEYYIPALKHLGWLGSAVVADVSAEALGRVRRTAKDVTTSQGAFDTVLSSRALSARFDAAIVALPNSQHEEASGLALQCGLDVLCEKPLSLSERACLRLDALATSEGRVLGVGMVRRLLPSLKLLRKALQRGLIGRLLEITIEDGGPYNWLSDTGAFFRPENGGV